MLSAARKSNVLHVSVFERSHEQQRSIPRSVHAATGEDEQQHRIEVLQGAEPLDNNRLARQRGTGLRGAYLSLAEAQEQ